MTPKTAEAPSRASTAARAASLRLRTSASPNGKRRTARHKSERRLGGTRVVCSQWWHGKTNLTMRPLWIRLLKSGGRDQAALALSMSNALLN